MKDGWRVERRYPVDNGLSPSEICPENRLRAGRYGLMANMDFMHRFSLHWVEGTRSWRGRLGIARFSHL